MERSKLRHFKRLERNLLACYHSASSHIRQDGLSWYPRANAYALELSTRYAITLQQSCGVIAALSPGLSWDVNKRDARDLIREYRNGSKRLPMVGCYGRKNVIKCAKILSGKTPLSVLGGYKVRSFYSNLLYPNMDYPLDIPTVTIDRHAKCCLLGDKSAINSVVRPKEYEWIANHFRHAASSLGLSVPAFQAVCWLQWRATQGNLDQVATSFDFDTATVGVSMYA